MPSYLKVNYSYALITGEESDRSSVLKAYFFTDCIIKWPRDTNLQDLARTSHSDHGVMAVVINL
jgi:hypothetical protein